MVCKADLYHFYSFQLRFFQFKLRFMAAWRKEEVYTRLDIARRREKQRDWKTCYYRRRELRLEFCKATPIGLVDEPKKSLYGRETDRDQRKACRCVALFFIFYLFIFFLRTSSVRGGGWGGYAARLFLDFSFSRAADHERDRPRCKVVFSGWQPIRSM